jgi:aryl-alcohol dehydrogenase
MEITAALVESRNAPFELCTVTLDDPRPDELLLRIVASGLCHTDLSVRSGATPFPVPAVLGHEGAGIVESVGSQVADFAPGDRVLVSFTSCGTCRNCRRNQPVYCEHWLPLNLLGGSRLDGSAPITRTSGPVHGHFFGQSSFATHALVHARAAIKVPADIDLASVAPLGCSVQTGTGAVLNVACPQPGSSLVVYGAGGVGLAAIMAAVLTPAVRVIAVDVNKARLDLARELGATATVDASQDNATEVVLDLTGGGADYAIETSGRLTVLDGAVAALASAGTCVVIGAPPLGSTLPVDIPNLLGRGIRLVGTNQGDSNPREYLPELLALHQAGRLPFEKLIHRFPFEHINDAAIQAHEGAVIKPVLVMADDGA